MRRGRGDSATVDNRAARQVVGTAHDGCARGEMVMEARKTSAACVGWGHAPGDGRSSDADWGEQMAARCREACDGRAEWKDIFERDDET